MTSDRLANFRFLSGLSLIVAIALGGCLGPSAPQKTVQTSANRPSPVHQQSNRLSSEPAARPESTSSESRSYSPSDGDSAGVEGIASRPQERPGLGTVFGEQRQSRVHKREFQRASNHPFAKVALHYNNLAGVQQQSWFRGTDLHELRAQTKQGGISISVLDQYGRLLRGGTGAGRTYVVGQDGMRYSLQVRNDTGGSYEVVGSVDGLDLLDGEPASLGKRGYIIAPYSTLTIDGFRTSHESVAAFRFGAVSNSYAARTSGDRNVGVIGFAFFAERGSRWTNDEIRRRETADPFPGGYAKPPRY